MPATLLKSLAASTGLSLKTLERHWDEAKKIVKKEYGLDETNPRFWALTTGVTKKMSGIKETLSFKEFLEAYGGDRLDQVRAAGFDVTMEYEDEEWTATGKIGTNRQSGAQVAEYTLHTPEGERRIWADAAGNVYKD
jgi:hypothetical protein